MLCDKDGFPRSLMCISNEDATVKGIAIINFLKLAQKAIGCLTQDKNYDSANCIDWQTGSDAVHDLAEDLINIGSGFISFPLVESRFAEPLDNPTLGKILELGFKAWRAEHERV